MGIWKRKVVEESTQLPAFPFSNPDDAEKRLGFDGCEEIGIFAAATTAVDVVKGR